MEKINQEISLISTRNLLLQMVEGISSKERSEWIREKINEIESQISENKFYQILGRIPSMFPKNKIGWSNSFLKKASSLEEGWDPQEWTVDQTVRIIMLLTKSEAGPEGFEKIIRKYHQTADLGEQVVINLALPLLPERKNLVDIAALGVRSNIKVVVEAISLRNPFPNQFFDLAQWNQLVLKALFIGIPLYKIQGLDKRANSQLASMLSDFAHERWAAGRKVSPELWRPVGPFINETIFNDILKIIHQGDELEKEAAALACSFSSYEPARNLLEKDFARHEKILSGELNWKALGEKWEKLQQ